jgi:hypothetical protein
MSSAQHHDHYCAVDARSSAYLRASPVVTSPQLDNNVISISSAYREPQSYASSARHHIHPTNKLALNLVSSACHQAQLITDAGGASVGNITTRPLHSRSTSPHARLIRSCHHSLAVASHHRSSSFRARSLPAWHAVAIAESQRALSWSSSSLTVARKPYM